MCYLEKDNFITEKNSILLFKAEILKKIGISAFLKFHLKFVNYYIATVKKRKRQGGLTMGVKNIFKRYELKFMLTTQQYINNPKPIKT